MLIVIVIAGILATITLNLNRNRIHQMQALDEREQRLDRHNHLNRELTNTNYLEEEKV
jgi:type II secretory pathway pseudopilin PulG